MSFSTDIKMELSEINNLAKKDEVKYELLGYLSSENITKIKNTLKYSTENEYNINRFAKLLKNVGINDFKIEIQGKVYLISFKSADLENVYIDKVYFAYILNGNYDFILYEKEEYNKSFIRGLFLGSGSINNPNNRYHLEIKIPNDKLMIKIVEILEKYDINVKASDKGIYIKDGEEISKFLAFIGASKSVLQFEEIRVQRDMNNKVNRLVNCKSANLNKTINASIEQINAIKKLKKSGKYKKIDSSLQELAELRLKYPDMPLSELRTNA